ncbi:MAG: ATP-binding protein [Pseudomonadota bacterium]
MTKKSNNSKQAQSAEEQVEMRFDPPEDLSLILRKVRILVQLRLEWLAYLVEQQASLLEDDEPAAEIAWRRQYRAEELARLEKIERALSACENSAFQRLVTLFNLKSAEIAVLQTCVAVQLDPSMRQHLGLVQNRPGDECLTDYAIARLHGFGRAFKRPESIPLSQWQLVYNSAAPVGLTLDTQIFNWLMGEHELHPMLADRARLIEAKPPLELWPLEPNRDRLQKLLELADGEATVTQVLAHPGQGKKTFAAGLCQELGLMLLTIDVAAVSTREFRELYRLAQRQAFLDGCALGWENLEYVLPNSNLAEFPLQFIFSSPEQANRLPLQKSALHIELPDPTDADKRRLWSTYLPASDDWSQGQRQRLLSQPVKVADIANQSRHLDTDLSSLRQRASQEHLRQLSGLATRLTTPFIREDWIVNQRIAGLFDDIVFEGRERSQFWQSQEFERLFPRGKGLIAMLSGPSGTGKTMGVQVAARELDMELFRVDLSRVVSKYIGETAENLAKVIQRAERLNVIMLFDEADALFSKRTDVKDSIDRHANMDVNYLLQAIEDYSGIAFLATNKKSNIDHSFIRRLRYVVEFPMPDFAERQQLWERLLSSMAEEQMPEHSAELSRCLAEQIELSGAQIKYSILSALFIAKRMGEPLNHLHLLEGIARELSKDGRSLATHERESILKSLASSSVQAASA